jgi:hypothetical protein
MIGGTTTHPNFSDETLVAFADGELDAETRAAVMAALPYDAALARRIALFQTTRAALAATFAPVAREAVPERLTRAATSQLGSSSTHRASSASRYAWPMAAALACIIVGSGGYWIGSRDGSPAGGTLAIAATAEPELQRMLAAAPDGTSHRFATDGDLVLRASYRTRAGFCRSFSITDNAGTSTALNGVACNGANGWQTQMVGIGSTSGTGIAPANGGDSAVEAFLDGVEADDPLDVAAVQSLIANGWR